MSSATPQRRTRARAAVTKLMVHHADTVRTTQGDYSTPAEQTVHLVFTPCLYEEKMTSERDDEGGITRTKTARIFFPSGTDVNANDLITSVASQENTQLLPVDADGNVLPMAVDGDPVDTGAWLECTLSGIEGAR